MRPSLGRWLVPGQASLTVGTAALVVALFAVGPAILDLVELKAYDLRFLSRGPRQPSPVVALAVIDEKSIDAEGRFPWPRSKIAALVDALSRDGARVIGFDVAFSEPDENSQLSLLDEVARRVDNLRIRDPRLDTFLSESRRRADNDRALAEALERSSAAVVLGYFFHMSGEQLGFRMAQEDIDRQFARIAGSKYPLVRSRNGAAGPAPLVRAYVPEASLDVFIRAAASVGYFTVRSDPDGVVRRLPLVIQGGEDLFPPLSILSVWHYLGRPPLTVRTDRHAVEGIQIGDRFVSTHENGELLVSYLGPERTFPHYSITDILRGTLPKGTFADRIVLVGATAIGLSDLRSTPFDPVYPGLEIHATVIDNVLTGDLLLKPRWSVVYDILAIVGLGVLIGVVLPRVSALTGLLVATGLFVLYIGLAQWLFVQARIWLNMVYPLLALAMTYTALTVYRYFTEERERRKIKDAFVHYVAPVVIEQMLKDPDRLKLGGDDKVLTVMFSDLEGFTTYSERYSPIEMTAILSDYYERMTEQIFAWHGTLKEYVGDELMAIFGAPIEHSDHAERACAAALAMREHRHALGVEWEKIGRPRLRARTGINSGSMLVGNMGSKYRFSFGVLGDQVNLASRLEGLNRFYGTEILVGENTANLVNGAFVLREIDMVRVKGKKQAVRIYDLLARSASELPAEHQKALSLYAAGLEAYRQQSWNDALGLLGEALTLWPGDGPSRTMVERCRTFQQTPPPEGWDGVYDQLVKG